MGSVSIDFPRDRRLGFLSYTNEEPIEIDGKIWPSIERYVLGQSFSGTSLEEKVRLSKSPTVTSKMTKTIKKIELLPDGSIIRKEVHISGAPLEIDFDRVVNKAIENKFRKHEEKLLETFPIKFESRQHPRYASILTKYRNALYAAKLRESKVLLDLTSDLPNLDLFETLVDIMEDIVSKLKEIDNVKKSHPGLYDDALWNMAPKGRAEKILKNMNTDKMMREMPNQQKLVAKSFGYLTRKFPDKFDDPEFQELAGKMWATFRWQIMRYLRTGEKYNWDIKKSHLKLRPVPRPYRKSKVRAPHLKTLVVRTEEYAKLFGGRDDYEALVESYERMDPSVRDVKIERMLAEKAKESKKEIPKKEELGQVSKKVERLVLDDQVEEVEEVEDEEVEEEDFDKSDEEIFEEEEEEIFSEEDEEEEDEEDETLFSEEEGKGGDSSDEKKEK